MKKIMFNDKYGLTQAVLEGRKTMTRRIIPPIVIDWNRRGKVTLPVSCFKGKTLFMDASAIFDQDFEYPAPAKYQPKFEAGEIVAVAQKYKDIPNPFLGRGTDYTDALGWENKMFVKAELMPHQIIFTSVRLEHLQDISDQDCFKEGVYDWRTRPDCPDCVKYSSHILYGYPRSWDGFLTPRDAFAALIDKTCGKGTWERNPLVYVYDFQMVK